MSILDQLKADFLPSTKQLEKSTVKLENSDEKVTVYFRTAVNAVQADKYMPLMHENKIEGYVELLLHRALKRRR